MSPLHRNAIVDCTVQYTLYVSMLYVVQTVHINTVWLLASSTSLNYTSSGSDIWFGLFNTVTVIHNVHTVHVHTTIQLLYCGETIPINGTNYLNLMQIVVFLNYAFTVHHAFILSGKLLLFNRLYCTVVCQVWIS